VTKLVTTLMLFKLRDAGMLSLDDPIHVHDSLPSCEC
jgi:CubicO group peptidase (beta-lactamase class C family)